jgi:hypothetical protein
MSFIVRVLQPADDGLGCANLVRQFPLADAGTRTKAEDKPCNLRVHPLGLDLRNPGRIILHKATPKDVQGIACCSGSGHRGLISSSIGIIAKLL